ncbi:MAG: hypothetical protein KGI14_07945 [Acidobacteriota bacterium]|nr:hypothetical protein [Acidobacteriota bacterium]
MKKTNFRRTYNGAIVGALVVATSLVVPASLAGASSARAQTTANASVSGAVIARNSARHTIVVSSGATSARTLRLRSAGAVNAVALGAVVSAKTTKLADGTFHVNSLKAHGRTRHAKLRATVVAATSGRVTLASGGSVLVVGSSKLHAHDSSSSGPAVGTVVNVAVDINASGLDETSLQQVGTTNLIQLEGTLSAVSASSLVLAVEDGASTTVAIPASLTLPSTIAVGDQVEVLVDYASQTFTLVTITDDSAAASGNAGVTSNEDNQGNGDQQGNNSMQIEGLVVAANATSLTIQPGDQAAPVVVSVPSTIDVSTLSVGERVHAEATLVAGVLTLTSVRAQSSEGDQGQSMSTEVEGVVVSVSATSLVIQPGDQATPVTLAVPSTVDVSSVAAGDRVHARGELVNNVLTLSSIRVQGPENGDQAQSSEVDGTVTAVSATSLTVQPSDQAAAITLAVPATLNVSSVQVGDELHATATLVGGVLTLSNFEISGANNDVQEFSGVVSAVSATSLSIQAGDNSALVVLAVPASVNVSAIAVGDHVNATATTVAGVLTLATVSLDS